MSKSRRVLLTLAVALTIPTGVAWAIGFGLGQSKEELQLKYDVSVYDHDTGRVTIKFSLEDEGRLSPIRSIDLSIPSEEKHAGGGYKSDLTLSMAAREEDGKRVARIHIRKDWAERAEIQLKTSSLDGKQEPLTWYYHSIPLQPLIAQAKPHKSVH